MTATNTFGRQVVVPLTNKSGGSVAAGDFVYLGDGGTTTDSFTTGTTSGYTGSVGIAQETIASNAIGRVLVMGYAALVNVNASVTRNNFGKGHSVAKQATDAGAARGVGTCLLFLNSGTTPDAILWQPDLGGASMTNPMTTTGDIIYSSDNSGTPARLAVGAAGKFLSGGATPAWGQGPLTTDGDLLIGATAGTPTRLAKGNAGGNLGMSNGSVAWDAGTSFPGSPATNDRYYRTDLGLECFYDGTRWLTTTLYRDAINSAGPGGPISATQGYYMHVNPTYDIYAYNLDVLMLSSSLTGSAYWTCTLYKQTSANAQTQLGSAVNDQSGSNSTWEKKTITVNAVIASASGGTFYSLQVAWTKVSTPGQLYGLAVLNYRLVIT